MDYRTNWKKLLAKRTRNKFKGYRLVNTPTWVFERGVEINQLQKFMKERLYFTSYDGNLNIWIDNQVESALFMAGADLGDPESIYRVIKRLYEHPS